MMLLAAFGAALLVCVFRLTMGLMVLEKRDWVPGTVFIVEAVLAAFAAFVIATMIE